jgi:hypothetical protein
MEGVPLAYSIGRFSCAYAAFYIALLLCLFPLQATLAMWQVGTPPSKPAFGVVGVTSSLCLVLATSLATLAMDPLGPIGTLT